MKICSLVTKLVCLVTNKVNKAAEGRNLTDEEILKGILSPSGMDGAIESLYHQYFSPLRWYVINNSGTKQDAEDIFQEVVISFVRLVHDNKFRGESSIQTFLFSMNRNAWLNELKRRKRALKREERFENEKDRDVADVNYFIADREAKTELLDLLSRLGETCKKILTLFYFEDRSLREILTTLEYENEQVVRNKKYKCMKKLKEQIEARPATQVALKNMLHG